MWEIFTTVECRISSRLIRYKNHKNRLRLAKVIVKNKMSRFYGSVCILLHSKHSTFLAVTVHVRAVEHKMCSSNGICAAVRAFLWLCPFFLFQWMSYKSSLNDWTEGDWEKCTLLKIPFRSRERNYGGSNLGGPEIAVVQKSQKVGGPRPARPNIASADYMSQLYSSYIRKMTG